MPMTSHGIEFEEQIFFGRESFTPFETMEWCYKQTVYLEEVEIWIFWLVFVSRLTISLEVAIFTAWLRDSIGPK